MLYDLVLLKFRDMLISQHNLCKNRKQFKRNGEGKDPPRFFD